jgi:acetyltransferase EpsM
LSDLIIFGAGGLCKVIIDAVERSNNRRIYGILDDDQRRWGTQHYQYQIIGGRGASLPADYELVIAVGNNFKRREILDLFLSAGVQLATVIDPSAYVARSARLGGGTVVLANAVVSSDATVGSNTIVDMAAVVSHDCWVGDDVHLCPGAQICGGATVESGAMIGAAAVVIPHVIVGRGASVGAGSSVLRNVEAGSTVLGSPARLFRQASSD